ncbi:Glutamate-1-semialdehyde 2,1-aminomutase [Halomicronema hongdechloris C2206]|uniref:Acetylornithine aminotransferase n=1 Tax=Halomicronema hongdechloris C2206 TaxID=1641165 RepID=A0A1Z3HJF3_9CYAN|nr:aspartate aminotransferase family protein [Halomicronema hongdechloris]ASC70237.1 Glutamate-1-semialdehyde 2,1-aminomutase [Halomicronema hongdechloris C2206]
MSQLSPVLPSVTPATAFNPTQFDTYVMATYGRFPIALVRGEGCRVWDSEGRSYLDFVSGIATCTLGHAHPAMVKAITGQIQRLHHVSNLYYIPEQGALAQWLVEHSCADRAFFCNSGAEANEGAIKLARKYAHLHRGIEQPVILTAHASFHGRTLATITATGQPKYQKHFAPLVPGFHYIPYNDIDALRQAVADLDGSTPHIAAILLEPLQGEGGVRPGERHYFQQVRQLCDDTGILLILDEVQVGMGRTGRLWGYEQLGIEPDLLTSAKGLGGGIPIGAMLCQRHCDVLQPGDHASTFGGNPLACGVALQVCHTLETDDLVANAQYRGEQLRQGLSDLAWRFPHLIADVRGWGLINGLELTADTAVRAIDVVKAAMAAGLLVVPAGAKVVRLVPPLIVTAPAIEEALARLSQALSQVATAGGASAEAGKG